jgi:hypothetical protein
MTIERERSIIEGKIKGLSSLSDRAVDAHDGMAT